jgi:hypothetical protein
MKVKVGEDCLYKRVSLFSSDQTAQDKEYCSNLVWLMKVKVGEDCLYKRMPLQPGDQAVQAKEGVMFLPCLVDGGKGW